MVGNFWEAAPNSVCITYYGIRHKQMGSVVVGQHNP